MPLTSKKGAGGGAPSLIAAEVGRDRSQPPFSASGADGRGHRQKKKKKRKKAAVIFGKLPGIPSKLPAAASKLPAGCRSLSLSGASYFRAAT